MSVRFAAFLIVLSIFSSCCREDCANTYIIEGVVSEQSTSLPCIGFEVELKEQILENGILNGFFETAGTTTTDESGFFTISFPRKNALEYQLEVISVGWFAISENINPEDFTPDIPLHIDLEATPKAQLKIKIMNSSPSYENDKVRIRMLGDFGQLTDCGNDWFVFEGPNVNDEINCSLPGDKWMPYLFINQSYEDDIQVVDSVFCSAFETTVLEINY
ncbi:MAG: hypothetical protein O2852_05570 [Bacteroidetes bacterium]|jgi:hypothetical protein|nr:hypothetical protein [Bacteroidota bacterium]MDA0980803.1 hypothetical protein [Bacteroidota bacterium]